MLFLSERSLMRFPSIKLWTTQRENNCKAIRIFSKRISYSVFFSKLSRFINKHLYKLGIGSSLNRYDNSFTIYSSKADSDLYKNFDKSSKFINFGSGTFFHNRWKNYDYPGLTDYYKSVQGSDGEDFYSINLCDPNLSVPEKNESVDLIYCSHTLEHIDAKSSNRFLIECFRILKKNGVMRVALPNTKNDFFLLRCILSQNSISKEIKQNYLRKVASHILTDTQKLSMEEIIDLSNQTKQDSEKFFNNSIKMNNDFAEFKESNPERHINYWDFENLITKTSKIGFSCCIPCYQGISVASPFSNLHVFDNTEPQISIYADIIK